MDKTILIAVLTLVIVPLIVAAVQNTITRLGKKDDLTIAREQLIFQREEAIQRKQQAYLENVESELEETKKELEKLKLEKPKDVPTQAEPQGPVFLLPAVTQENHP